MPIIPLTCPNCGGNLTVDSSLEAAVCTHCKKPYIVKDAVFQNYITNITNINADTVNVYSEKDFEIRGGKLLKYNGESLHVSIPESVKIIGSGVFCDTAIESVVIPNSVEKIEGGGYYSSFARCRYLKEVSIPGSVQIIGSDSFRGCDNLESVKLEEGLKTIKEYAFCDCTSLRSVTIPSSVEEIEPGAFNGCSSLQNVTFLGELPDMARHSMTTKYINFDHVFHGSPFGRKKQAEEYAKQEQMRKAERRKKGVCQYCGAPFGGMFTKKCSKCGKPKDY